MAQAHASMEPSGHKVGLLRAENAIDDYIVD